jgi:outer membrane protein assembly factor BamB
MTGTVVSHGGDISLKEGQDSNESIAWSKKRGGVYVPTPLLYSDYLYVCANHGVLSCYNAKTGEKVYQERIGEKVVPSRRRRF